MVIIIIVNQGKFQIVPEQFQINPSRCCEFLQWNRGNETNFFRRTEATNELWPVFESVQDEETISMWWMWHGPVGHWVINQTPGAHGNDIIKARLEDIYFLNERFYHTVHHNFHGTLRGLKTWL